jgi:hypothetical protein
MIIEVTAGPNLFPLFVLLASVPGLLQKSPHPIILIKPSGEGFQHASLPGKVLVL